MREFVMICHFIVERPSKHKLTVYATHFAESNFLKKHKKRTEFRSIVRIFSPFSIIWGD